MNAKKNLLIVGSLCVAQVLALSGCNTKEHQREKAMAILTEYQDRVQAIESRTRDAKSVFKDVEQGIQSFDLNDTRKTQAAIEKMKAITEELQSARKELEGIRQEVMQRFKAAGVSDDVAAEVLGEKRWSL